MPIIKDLFVDLTPFWDKYVKIKPYLIPGTAEPEREFSQAPDRRDELGNSIDCILCACCYSACSMTASDDDYIGPAALLKAQRFSLIVEIPEPTNGLPS